MAAAAHADGGGRAAKSLEGGARAVRRRLCRSLFRNARVGRAGVPQGHHGMGTRPLHGNHLMPQPWVGTWDSPPSIRFGAGRSRELPEACKAVGLKRPLLVTDPGLAKLPMIADAMLALRKAGIEVALFSDVKPNPIASNVESGIKVLRAAKHDGVIAWGGGSGIDTAKAIAFIAGPTRPMWDFEDVGDWWTRANPAGLFPSIAVPTTAGPGSETRHY